MWVGALCSLSVSVSACKCHVSFSLAFCMRMTSQAASTNVILYKNIAKSSLRFFSCLDLKNSYFLLYNELVTEIQRTQRKKCLEKMLFSTLTMLWVFEESWKNLKKLFILRKIQFLQFFSSNKTYLFQIIKGKAL